MAAGITERDGMVYVGEAPWHGLGVKLPQVATMREVLEACPSLAAPIVKEQIARNGKDVYGKFFTVREDTQEVLGIVGDTYKVVQNEQAFKFFDAVCQDPNGPKYHTAGTLWGGRKTWLLAKLPECIEVVKSDPIEQYVLLSNTHDGSQALRVQETPIRVVCQNTLTMAQRGNRKKVVIRHSGDITTKIGKVQDLLGIIRQDFALTGEVYRDLARDYPTDEEITRLLKLLIPDTESKRAEKQRERVQQLALTGAGNDHPLIRGTAYALYQGFTELVDHVDNAGSKRSDAEDMRLNAVWFGGGAQRKANALDVVCDICLK